MANPHPRLLGPADLPGPTGGTRYNEQVAAQWGINIEPVPGRWPQPTAQDLARLAAVIEQGSADSPVLLDGLIAGACPTVLAHARAAHIRVHALVHLPLPAETHLTADQAAALAQVEAAALHTVAGVACTSSWAAQDLRRRYDLTGVTVAEPGCVPAPSATGSTPARLLTPASFSARKNHRVLMAALVDPRVRSLAWSAHWVGAEPEPGDRARLVAAVAKAGLSDRVEVAAARTGGAWESTWHQADLMVLPSLAETYAMVVTEALARGIPALVGAGTAAEHTLHGPPASPATASTHGTAGLALDPRDPAAWSEAVHRFLTEPTLRQQWRAAAAARRPHLPTWRQTADHLHAMMFPERR